LTKQFKNEMTMSKTVDKIIVKMPKKTCEGIICGRYGPAGFAYSIKADTKIFSQKTVDWSGRGFSPRKT
jgi:hypothetical protein